MSSWQVEHLLEGNVAPPFNSVHSIYNYIDIHAYILEKEKKKK